MKKYLYIFNYQTNEKELCEMEFRQVFQGVLLGREGKEWAASWRGREVKKGLNYLIIYYF